MVMDLKGDFIVLRHVKAYSRFFKESKIQLQLTNNEPDFSSVGSSFSHPHILSRHLNVIS